MPKTFTDLSRHALNGPTMGTRWSALFHMPADFDARPVAAALAAVTGEVDGQMSTWKSGSDLMRLNAAAPGTWVEVPEGLIQVLSCGLQVGRLSDGAFDIGIGDAVAAWGFGPSAADPERIHAALGAPRRPTHEVLEIEVSGRRVRKHASLALDLSGIAKGYGVDRLARVIETFGIPGALVGIDGDLRALGRQPDGSPWTVAVERPDHAIRAPFAILALEEAAVATSGDYRHWVEVRGQRLSHTMDPRRGGPLTAPPASVTVVASTCMEADAWATALMVKGTLAPLWSIGSVWTHSSSIAPPKGCAKHPWDRCSRPGRLTPMQGMLLQEDRDRCPHHLECIARREYCRLSGLPAPDGRC